jgi:hypothetical protein
MATDWPEWSTSISMLKLKQFLMNDTLSGFLAEKAFQRILTHINANHRPLISAATNKKATVVKSGNKNEPKEVTMTRMASTRRSDYWMACVRCGDMLVAPERSEYVSDGQVRNLWRCSECSCSFEISVLLPKAAQSVIEGGEAFFPSLFAA